MGSADEVAPAPVRPDGWSNRKQSGRSPFPPPVSEKAEVADSHKTAWQHVEEEAAKELFDRQGHEPFLIAVSGVAPAKGYVAVGESNQPAVGNGNAVGVGAEIAQHMFWPAERPFGVDDPVVTEQYPQPRSEGARFRKR